MNETADKLCRFCLSEICELEFEPIEETVREIIIDILQLQLNLDVSKGPVICGICATNMRRVFNFKSACLEIEDELFPFIWKTEKDLIKVYSKLKQQKNGSIQIGPEQVVCRLCLTLIQQSSAVWPSAQQNSELLDVLEKYFSQMALDHFDQPGLCSSCIDLLNIFLKLLATTQNTEMKIERYIKCHGTDDLGHINLSNIKMPSCHPVKHEPDEDYDGEVDASLPKDGTATKCENVECDDEAIEIEENDFLDEKILMVKEDMESNSLKKGNKSIKRKGKRKRMNPKTFRCKICSYRTCNVGHLTRHLLVHKNSSEVRMHQCDKCNFRTKHEGYLKIHSLQHVDQSTRKLYRCESCPYKTMYETTYKRHLNYHIDPSTVPVYKCEPCDFKTFYKNAYEYHILGHKSESEVTLLKCDQCHFQSRHRSALVQHVLIHKEPVQSKLYKCEMCDYKGKTKNRLRTHLYTHKPKSEVKMYQCSVCSYESRYRYVVKNHEVSHKSDSEVTMYECDRCTYQTRFTSALNAHKKRHDKK